MGSILKFRYMRMDLTMNSSDDDKIKDHTVVADEEINNLNLNDEECSSDKELGKSWQPGTDKVPKKPRTPRVLLGLLTSKPGEDGYRFRSAGQVIIDDAYQFQSADQVIIDDAYQFQSADRVIIIDEKNSRESGKRPLDEDYIVSDEVLAGQLTCEPREDAYQYRNAQVVIDEKNTRKSEKHPLDEDYNVFDDDNRVESSDKKRQKNGEKKAVAVGRKQAPQVQNYPTPELPQNLQDYISKLNLEAPLLFVAQKNLYPSDVRRNLHRLLLPKSLINKAFFENFVTDNENKMLMDKEDVRVSLVDNKMHEYHTLNFVKWDMTDSSNYALKTGWPDVVTDNKLEAAVLQKDVNKLEEAQSPKKRKENAVVVMKEDGKLMSPVKVQLWCSRKEGRIWFALNIQAMTEHNVVGKTKDGRNIITRLIN